MNPYLFQFEDLAISDEGNAATLGAFNASAKKNILMTSLKKRFVLFLLFVQIIFVHKLFSQNLAYQEFEKDSIQILKSQISHTNIDFTRFDKSSIVKESKISYSEIKGIWQAYKGLLIIGEQFRPMNLSTPLIVQIDSNKIRHSLDGNYEFFSIKKGKLISQSNESLGIINKITDKVLVITLQNNIAMTRYYYELKE